MRPSLHGIKCSNPHLARGLASNEQRTPNRATGSLGAEAGLHFYEPSEVRPCALFYSYLVQAGVLDGDGCQGDGSGSPGRPDKNTRLQAVVDRSPGYFILTLKAHTRLSALQEHDAVADVFVISLRCRWQGQASLAGNPLHHAEDT
jgi:hypothetical protein